MSQISKIKAATITFVNSGDKVNPPLTQSLPFHEALLNRNVPSQLHIFPAAQGKSNVRNMKTTFRERILWYQKHWGTLRAECDSGVPVTVPVPDDDDDNDTGTTIKNLGSTLTRHGSLVLTAAALLWILNN